MIDSKVLISDNRLTKDRRKNIFVWGSRRIGSVIGTFPALKIIKLHSPQARIFYLTSLYASEILKISGLAETIHTIKSPIGGIFDFFTYYYLKKKAHKNFFDRLFVFAHDSEYSRWMGPIINQTFLASQFTGHHSERCAHAVMNGFGIEMHPIPSPKIDIPDQIDIFNKFAALGLRFLEQQYLVLHPGCWKTMRGRWKKGYNQIREIWPPGKFRVFIERFRERHPDVRIVLVGTSRERDWVELEILKELKHKKHVLNICGYTNLRELLHLLKYATVLVAGDLGVMHLGTVTGTPMIILFGPTNEHATGPFGMGDMASFIRTVPYDQAIHDPYCMDKCEVDVVLKEVELQWHKPRNLHEISCRRRF